VLAKVGGGALLVLFMLLLEATSSLLLKMDPWSYVVMAAAVATSLGIGHAPGPLERTSLAMESAARHPGLFLTIASLNVSRQQALPVLIRT